MLQNYKVNLRQLQTIASTNSKEINDAIDHNKRVSAHNAKVDALIEQKNEFTIRQTSVKDDILIKSDQSISLNILKKAFSTSGIVAFKLENLTKELEVTINYYLSLLSDGQFQVEFTLDKEKLNITVINNGISTPIETVSGGEFSRIQTSVLLAIRSLLSKLGGSSINLLFLDEITGVLDDEGKEKLVEVLQKEHDLNVFLISHDFTHPLIDKISIVKNNNISSIQ
jgi:DNA repair exonuclease SbcCD ATPase subunit